MRRIGRTFPRPVVAGGWARAAGACYGSIDVLSWESQ
jgi:hypothetical protein